jgi:hypothetical protein
VGFRVAGHGRALAIKEPAGGLVVGEFANPHSSLTGNKKAGPIF